MKKAYLIGTIWLVLIFLMACRQEGDKKLRIATAANMQFAIQELIDAFSEETGIEAEAIISSSGKLTAQIKEGAPFDVFVSADMKYPTELRNSGLTKTEPVTYAFGRLVLWSLRDDLEVSVATLDNAKVKHIALANPKTAPYGEAAVEVLKHHGHFNRVESKLVYGESIAQTNQFIISMAADMGFTAKSVVLSARMKNKGHWIELDPENYTPIAQGLVILNRKNELLDQAQQFKDFLFSQKGREILVRFGYAVSE